MPDERHPYDRPTDPAKRHSAALTDGPDRAGRPLDAQGHRLHRRGPGEAARRRRDDLDRDDAVQLQPAPPGRAREGRHPGGRRHADGVQHDLGQRRRLDGHRGHEGVAHQPRRHRRFDRARHARPPARRPRVPGRLRQDDARRGDGPGSARRARPRPLQRDDLPGRLQGPAQRDGRDRVRGDRGVPGRQDHARRAVRDRERRLPGRRARAAASSRPTR